MTTLEAIATQPLSTVNLDLQGLTVDAVQVNEVPATFSHREHELTIAPARPLTRDSSFSIRVNYHGSPQPLRTTVSADFASTVGWFHGADGSINVWSEPDGAAGWYPVNDHPRDKAAYRFEITVPKPWVVAASGTLRETTDQGERTRYVWEMDKPMASYLATINIDKYVVETAQGPNGVVIRSYFPSDFPDSLKSHFNAIPDMIQYFDSLFGAYPFSEYGVVIADGDIPPCNKNYGGAEETQTMSIHCPTSSMTEEWAIAHELAHQWFGDSVSLKNWQDIWLKEGMATYAEWLWLARGQDLDALNKVVKAEISDYFPFTRTSQPPADDLYRDEVYRGGALVFHVLRLKIGDEAFFKTLRTYLDKYRYGNAGTDEFIAVAEQVSGQDLRAFLNAWLSQTKLPEMPEPLK